MAEQMALFVVADAPKATDNERRKWEDGFQRWSNKQFQEGGSGYGACGYGSMCDYCEDNSYGRPCVRALNDMCRRHRITIDYEKTSYENAWEGAFETRRGSDG